MDARIVLHNTLVAHLNSVQFDLGMRFLFRRPGLVSCFFVIRRHAYQAPLGTNVGTGIFFPLPRAVLWRKGAPTMCHTEDVLWPANTATPASTLLTTHGPNSGPLARHAGSATRAPNSGEPTRRHHHHHHHHHIIIIIIIDVIFDIFLKHKL